MEQFITQLAQYGLLGLLLALMIYAYYEKDLRNDELEESRLKIALDIKDQYNQTVNAVNTTLRELIAMLNGLKGKKDV